MSKVKIQGDASGTGIFTVAAPATNTDRTITLPDVDATVMTSAGGIMTGRLDHDYAGDNIRLRGAGTHRITSTSGNPTYQLASSGGSAIAFVTDGSHDYINFETHWTGVQHAVAMTIDGKGRVTKPYQPVFMQSSLTGYNSVGYLKGTGTSYNLNRGNHYNSTNGRFTAPVAGIYLIMCAVLVESGSGRLEGKIQVNGNDRVNFNGTGTTYDGCVAIATLDLGVGDYVNITRQSGTAHSDGAHPSTYFGGYLLG